MILYARLKYLGAIHIEAAKDLGLNTDGMIDTYKDEVIINQPYTQIILTPPRIHNKKQKRCKNKGPRIHECRNSQPSNSR